PWIDADGLARDLNRLGLPGVAFRPVYFTPTFSKYQGETCAGVCLHANDRDRFRPVATGVWLLATMRARHPDAFAWLPPWPGDDQPPIDLLSGSAELREALDAGEPVPDLDLLAHWDAQ